MLFLILIPVILTAFLLYQYIFFTRVYYLGQSLHKFRELRCEVTLFLAVNARDQLSLNEALEHQLFLLKLDAIIRHFDQLKPDFFKFNTLKAVHSKLLLSTENLASHSSNHPILQQYKGKLKDCIFTAFQAIPFIRLRLFVFFIGILSKLGFARYTQQLLFLEKFSQLAKDTSQKGYACHS